MKVFFFFTYFLTWSLIYYLLFFWITLSHSMTKICFIFILATNLVTLLALILATFLPCVPVGNNHSCSLWTLVQKGRICVTFRTGFFSPFFTLRLFAVYLTSSAAKLLLLNQAHDWNHTVTFLFFFFYSPKFIPGETFFNPHEPDLEESNPLVFHVYFWQPESYRDTQAAHNHLLHLHPDDDDDDDTDPV